MSEGKEQMAAVFDGEEVREVLADSFYTKPDAPRRARARPRAKKKPSHYEVICISLYNEDLARLDGMVSRLKESGHRKMSRSALIRFALDTCDPSQLQKTY